MKSKPKEKSKKATDHPTQRDGHEMNRKQRREAMRKIQSEELSLELVHRDAAGIDIGNESHYVAVETVHAITSGRLAPNPGLLARVLQARTHK